MKIQEVAETIAIPLNRQYDADFMALLTSLIKTWRVKILQQKLHYKDIVQLLQSFDGELEDYKVSNLASERVTGVIKKTKYRIPLPIRNSIFQGPLYYVGTINKDQDFNYTVFQNMKFYSFNTLTANHIRYSYVNGYIYILGPSSVIAPITNIKIEGYFEEPVKPGTFNNCININVSQDPEDIFIHRDLVEAILKGVTSDLKILQPDNAKDETSNKDV